MSEGGEDCARASLYSGDHPHHYGSYVAIAKADVLQVAPDYMKPVRYDARKLQDLLGPPHMTSCDVGIGQTLAFLYRR